MFRSLRILLQADFPVSCILIVCYVIAVITGGTKSGVSAARRRIDLIVMSARQKQQFTHFISVPFIGDSIRKRFVEFKVNTISYILCMSSACVLDLCFLC